MIRPVTIFATAATLIFVSVAAPSSADARSRRGAVVAGALGGFVAGAAIGSAARGYHYGYYDYYPGYYDYDAYAYDPGYVYVPVRRYYRPYYGHGNCPIEGAYRPDESFC